MKEQEVMSNEQKVEELGIFNQKRELRHFTPFRVAMQERE
jgi:hypothetical protein